MDLRYVEEEFADYPPVRDNRQTRAKVLHSEPPSANRGRTRATREIQPHVEVDSRYEFGQGPPPRAHPYVDEARVQESRLEEELAAGHIVERRRGRHPTPPPVERIRPGFFQKPQEFLNDPAVIPQPQHRAQQDLGSPEHLVEQPPRPRSVVFSEVVDSWPEELPGSRLDRWTERSDESGQLIERIRRQAPVANQALSHRHPLRNSTQVYVTDPMNPVYVDEGPWRGEPWPTASAMQPVVQNEPRRPLQARLETEDELYYAHALRRDAAQRGRMGDTRFTHDVRAAPCNMVDHEGQHHNYSSRHKSQAAQPSYVNPRRPAVYDGGQTEIAWNQPTVVLRPTGRCPPPLPPRVRKEPCDSVRPSDTVRQQYRHDMAAQINCLPVSAPYQSSPADAIRDLRYVETRPLGRQPTVLHRSAGDDRQTAARYCSPLRDDRYRAANRGTTDSQRHRAHEDAPSDKNKRDQKGGRAKQSHRQHRAKGRDPGDNPSSPDSSSSGDDRRPPNRQSDAPRTMKGGKNKSRQADSSPDPPNGNDPDTSEPSDSDGHRNNPGRRHRSLRDTHKKTYLKLKDYDGRTCVEAYLARFEVVSKHNGWSEADRLEHLQCALEGNAAQVLWDQGSQGITSCRRLIKHLRQRFGAEGQQCVYRTQLRTRVRPKGEPLSVTVDEVRRLMALAYPGPMSGDKQAIAIDALLNMLGDGELVLKIREREPGTLEEALKVAMKLEAFQLAGAGSKETGRQPAYTRQVQSEATVCEPVADLKILMKEYNRLQSEKLDRLFDKLRQSQDPTPASKAPSNDQDGNLRQRPFGRGGDGRRRAPPRGPRPGDRCYNCGNDGHYANRCPLPRIATHSTEGPTSYPIPNFVSPPAPASQSLGNSGMAGGVPSTPSA